MPKTGAITIVDPVETDTAGDQPIRILAHDQHIQRQDTVAAGTVWIEVSRVRIRIVEQVSATGRFEAEIAVIIDGT